MIERICQGCSNGWALPLITGVTGQDSAHLAEFILSKGYIVHGVKRRSSSFNTERIDRLIHDPHEEVLHIDPSRERERARRAWESHLARAKWLTEHGYRDLLRAAMH